MHCRMKSTSMYYLLFAFLNLHSFDLDLPLECDDEYWEQGFQQPVDKPSSISFFNCYLRLIDILAYAMRLIVSASVDEVQEMSDVDTVYSRSTRLNALEITSGDHHSRSNKLSRS